MAQQAQSKVAQIRNLFNPGVGWVDKFLWIIERVMYLGSIRIEAFLRSDFGVRYFTFTSFIILGACDVYTGIFSEYADNTSYFRMFTLAFVFVGVCHQVAAFQRMRRGIITHTRSSGMPFRIWGVLPFASFWVIKRFYEPLICFTLAYCANEFLGDKLLAMSIAFSSICLLIKNNLEYARLRNLALDQIDAGIENDVMQDVVVEMKSPRDTKGVSLPGPFPKDRKVRQAMVDDFLGRLRGTDDREDNLVDRLVGELEAEQAATEDLDKVIMIDGAEEEEHEPVSPFVQDVLNDPEIQAVIGDGDAADQSEEIKAVTDSFIHPAGPRQSSPKPRRPGIRLYCETCERVTTGVSDKMIGRYVDCVRCATPIFVAKPG